MTGKRFFKILVMGGLVLTAGASVSIGVMGLNGIFATTLLTHFLVTIMGLGLEAGKYSIVVYLHQRWRSVKWKSRLLMMGVAAVVMSLTSFEVLALLSQQQLQSVGDGTTIWALGAVYGVKQEVLTAVISLAVTLIIEPMSLTLTFAACNIWNGKVLTKGRKRNGKIKKTGGKAKLAVAK